MKAFACVVWRAHDLLHEANALCGAALSIEVTVIGRVGGELLLPLAFEIDGVGQHQPAAWILLRENFWDPVTGLPRRPRIDRAQCCGLVGDKRHRLNRCAKFVANGARVRLAQRHGALDPGRVRCCEFAAAALRGNRITARARLRHLRRNARVETESGGHLGGGLAACARIEQRESREHAIGRNELIAAGCGERAVEAKVERVRQGRHHWRRRRLRRWHGLGISFPCGVDAGAKRRGAGRPK